MLALEVPPQFPDDLAVITADRRYIARELRALGVPGDLLTAIQTRALRSGRRQTGEFQSNRQSRWTLLAADPQYGTERDCKLIELRLMTMLLLFEGAPVIGQDLRERIEGRYLGLPIVPGTYKDSLLLEKPNLQDFIAEAGQPTHGLSALHLGHENPQIHPKHVPLNISWRTHRSNLIQGDMTLRQARIYFVKLIGRYFDLGELHVLEQ